jgi:two-component system, NtrC family, nitrogen regulation sensor histidine kinase NtrY
MKKPSLSAVVSVTGIFLLVFSLVFNHLKSFSLNEVAQNASREISQKYNKLNSALSQFNQSDQPIASPEFYNSYTTEKIGLYFFRHDTLLIWNNAQVPFVKEALPLLRDKFGFVKLRQGFYLYATSVKKANTYVALCLVKPAYELQNNYLKNNFESWTGIPADVDIDLNHSNKNSVGVGGQSLFSLMSAEEVFVSVVSANLCFAFFFIGLILILLGLLIFISKGIDNVVLSFILFGLLIFRATMLYFQWPEFFQKSVLFNLSIFGNANSSINFYLGDILINALFLLFGSVTFHLCLKQSDNKLKSAGQIFILTTFSFFIVDQFNQAIQSLINNSTLSFDFLSIFNIKFPAFTGITALAMFALALFVTVRKLFVCLGQKPSSLFLFSTLIVLTCVVERLLNAQQSIFETGWFLLFSAGIFVFAKYKQAQFTLALGLQVLIMSVITSVLLDSYIGKKQKQDLNVLSEELAEQHDAILESEFAAIPSKIMSDKKLNVLLLFLPTGKKEVEQLLKQKYFNEYFNRYNLEFSMFNANCEPLLSPKQAVFLNEGFFEDQIKYHADSTAIRGFYFLKNYNNHAAYIGRITINTNRLYVFLEPKQYEALGSFPDLLLDQSQQKQEIFKNFSYAIYRSGQTIKRYGDFNYPFFMLKDSALEKSNPDFDHYYFQHEEYTQVISQKKKTLTDRFTYNSYIFLFFSIICYGCYFIYSLVFTKLFNTQSLTRRIQSIIIVLLLLVMSAVGVTSGNLVSAQFEKDNKQQLQEKTQIIINELVSQFKPDEFFEESQKEVVNIKLNEYAHLFNTVISVFDKNGYLYNTSQPRLYELGLAAALANPVAFDKLKQNQSSAENVIEKAGSLNYSSLYTPLYNSKQKLVGFINLPYFARQSDLISELSGIISALINVYVILFVVSILAGLILSRYITKPLRLIKQQIANISLGVSNEKINWQSNDEIGRLVAEYNQMLIKLETSAALLAQNERESAWREMAKQVAHEIKNPLTPMKLNLQYLQHLMQNNPDDFKEKFENASAGIIEQIDSLAGIATEFSNFAKLPEARLQTINLIDVINSSVSIFDNQTKSWIVNQISEKEILVKGDKDQCRRVFNNILKNAKQALEGVNDPTVEIKATLNQGVVLIMISDNGCGIADALKSKIFSPNFTTKTTGSGLGLAMVKNIMQGFGGSVWFESEEKKGTTFYLEFLLA